jgi:hypothetical protein
MRTNKRNYRVCSRIIDKNIKISTKDFWNACWDENIGLVIFLYRKLGKLPREDMIEIFGALCGKGNLKVV